MHVKALKAAGIGGMQGRARQTGEGGGAFVNHVRISCSGIQSISRTTAISSSPHPPLFGCKCISRNYATADAGAAAATPHKRKGKSHCSFLASQPASAAMVRGGGGGCSGTLSTCNGSCDHDSWR